MEDPHHADDPHSVESSSRLYPPGHGTGGSATTTLSPASLDLQMPLVGRGLYLSGFGGVTNQAALRQRGVTLIVNVARELVDAFPRPPEGVAVRHYSLRDSEDSDLGRYLPELVDYIHRAIEDGGLVAVSCVAGVSRSASVVLAYRVRYERRSLRQAFDELKRARRVVSPNLGFWRHLLAWERAVTGHNSVQLRPHVCGMVPDLSCYQRYAEIRIKLAFTTDLLLTWAFWFVMLGLQVVVIVWF